MGIIFRTKYPGATFTDDASFSECFANLARSPGLDSKEHHHPWRRGLLKDAPVVFTHADLHARWYPAPWEFYKPATQRKPLPEALIYGRYLSYWSSQILTKV